MIMTMDRRPLTRSLRRTDVPRLDIRRTFRCGEAEDAEWQDGAVSERLEYSEYLRSCVRIGHSMRQAQRLAGRTSA